MPFNDTETLTSKERKAAYNKLYRSTHKEKISIMKKKWYSENKEKAETAKKKWRDANKAHISKRSKQWANNNPEKIKSKILKYRYGITLNDYNRMFTEQNGCCKICNIHASELKGPLQVDHSHITGIVRGLLCGLCNSRLGEGNIGRFNDYDLLYSKALGYIKLYKN
jgi:Recombination endonuclease VII